MATRKARVIVDFTYRGVPYRPDDLIEVEEDDLRMHRFEVDPHPDAVRYAEAQARKKRLQRESVSDGATASIVTF